MIPLSELQYRRQAMMEQMHPNSIVILPANALQTRSNDTEYPFRQQSDYWYCTGVAEPEGVFVLTQEKSFLFTLPKDTLAEIWNGRRLGLELAKERSGVDATDTTEDLVSKLVELINGHTDIYMPQQYNAWFAPVFAEIKQRLLSGYKQGLAMPVRIHALEQLLHPMRLVKSAYEIELMRKTCQISSDAHKRAMRFTKPGAFEYQVAAEIEHEFVMQGASGSSYGSICGGGENACILHYTENSDVLRDGDLLLIDAGAEYQGYAGDITRTFPINGVFTPAQRDLYQVVLESQYAALEYLKPGSTMGEAYQACARVLVNGLRTLGILEGDEQELLKKQAYRQYFMHGLGHSLGLDVHDVGMSYTEGKTTPLEPGMIFTVEPGLYIPYGADCPKKYQGIGIRIEDDILITDNGHENLTSDVPKEIAAIEDWMQA